jgi:hypothetical protein
MIAKTSEKKDSLGARARQVALCASLLTLALGGATPSVAEADTVAPGQLSRVMDSYRPAVRRACWGPVLEAKGSEGTVSARVQLDIVISPSGSVDVLAASGAEQSFPGLSMCVAGAMRKSRFPASSVATPLRAVFMFLEQ